MEEGRHQYINIMAKMLNFMSRKRSCTLAELFSMVLFIIVGDGQVLVSVKKTLRCKSVKCKED